jgi:hypothetical protein
MRLNFIKKNFKYFVHLFLIPFFWIIILSITKNLTNTQSWILAFAMVSYFLFAGIFALIPLVKRKITRDEVILVFLITLGIWCLLVSIKSILRF